MKKTKTSQLVLGAALLAVFLALYALIPGGQKPLHNLLMTITFLPVTVYAMNCGVKKSLIMVAAGGILSGLLLSPEVFLSYAACALLIGLVTGMAYGKCSRTAVILILASMHLVQNILEACIYFLLMDINVLDTYLWCVELFYERIPEAWLAIDVIAMFVEDLMVSAVPCIAVLVSGAKGVVSFQILKLLSERLGLAAGLKTDPKYEKPLKFTGGGVSIAYFCAICICAAGTALPLLSVVPYHFLCAAFASMGVLLAVLYAYYFYCNRIRSEKEHQKRLMYSFAVMALLPISIFAMPLVELWLLKKEREAPAEEPS